MQQAEGLKVIFTGPAFGPDGQAILRADLKAACLSRGMKIFDNYTRGCSLLVASRKDTLKAKKASQDGLVVMTYPEFITAFDIVIVVAQQSHAPKHRYVDTHFEQGTPHPSLMGGNLL